MIASWPMLGSLHVNTIDGSHDTGLLDIAWSCLTLLAGPALCRSGTNAFSSVLSKWIWTCHPCQHMSACCFILISLGWISIGLTSQNTDQRAVANSCCQERSILFISRDHENSSRHATAKLKCKDFERLWKRDMLKIPDTVRVICTESLQSRSAQRQPTYWSACEDRSSRTSWKKRVWHSLARF